MIKLAGRFRFSSVQYGIHQQLKKGYLNEKGWANSWYSRSAIDKKGNPIPWLSYPFIDFIGNRDLSQLSMFEYGMGSSTQWFSQRVKSLRSVEHEKDWFDKVGLMLQESPNTSLMFKDLNAGDEYVMSISNSEETYDLILIDGRKRVECSKQALDHLTPKGVIIWDNSDREKYQEGIDSVLSKGFKKIDFFGPAPGSYRSTCTSVLYRQDNCLGI